MTKRCEITGVNKKLLRNAVKQWNDGRSRKGVKGSTWVSQLPPPPIPGTAEYYRCISAWYKCYMQASYLDNYRNQMAQLEQAIVTGEGMLTILVSSYADCIGGMPA